MPVTAAALADVLVGDDHPAVALRGGDHPLDQGAVGLLDVGLPGELGLGVAQPEREGVTDPLELAGGEHPRPTDGADPPLEPGPRKGGSEELAETAFEVGNLTPQVVAREALGACRYRCAERIGAGRRRRDPGLCERVWHGGSFARCLPGAF
jgi:hypothetical protein